MSDTNTKVLIFLVCATVLIAIVLIMIYNPMAGRMLYKFGEISAHEREIDGDIYWDVGFKIIDDTSPDIASYHEVLVVIENENGKEMFRQKPLKRDDPTQYDDASDGTVDIEVWLSPSPDDNINMNIGDWIIVTGLTKQYQGATIYFYNVDDEFGESIGRIDFPSEF